MKKLIFVVAALVVAVTAGAQPQLANVSKIYVYGIDFSMTKVNATAETDVQFAKAFDGINNLLLTEPKKYDFGGAFRKMVGAVDIAPTQRNNAARDFSIMRTDPDQLVSEEGIQSLIKGYNLPQSEGTGVVFVAMLLNKAADQATFDVVFFDIATREIIFSREVTGKAGGFGLRNFWANPVYEVLKKWKTK